MTARLVELMDLNGMWRASVVCGGCSKTFTAISSSRQTAADNAERLHTQYMALTGEPTFIRGDGA